MRSCHLPEKKISQESLYFSSDKVQIMGIVNITPDSFSDGGRINNENTLLSIVDHMLESGADIIDIGGESSRPFAPPVSLSEELDRVIPAIRAIRHRYRVPISVDTTKAEVARRSLVEGADIINDISALRHDAAMISVAVEFQIPVIIMHMQGTPETMQNNPHYNDVVSNICDFLRLRIKWAEDRGLSRNKIIIDPGLGFGKTVCHNLTILRKLKQFTTLGCPVLIGHSRKSFIGNTLSIKDPLQRDEATAVISAYCVQNGASILRVHDVAKTAQAIKMIQAICKTNSTGGNAA